MSRPTDDPKSRVVKIRINEEMAEEIERYSSGNMSSAVRELIEKGLHGSSVKSKDREELESMAKCWNTTADALISDFVYLLQDGSIKMRNGMLWVDKTPRNWEKFEEECKKRKMSTEHALKNFMAVMV